MSPTNITLEVLFPLNLTYLCTTCIGGVLHSIVHKACTPSHAVKRIFGLQNLGNLVVVLVVPALIIRGPSSQIVGPPPKKTPNNNQKPNNTHQKTNNKQTKQNNNQKPSILKPVLYHLVLIWQHLVWLPWSHVYDNTSVPMWLESLEIITSIRLYIYLL